MQRKHIILLTSYLTFNVWAQIPSEEQVLMSTEEHFPVVRQALDQLLMSENDLRAARGLYDTKLTSDSYLTPHGHYQRYYWEGKVEKPLRFANSRIYAGASYAYSGNFPPQYSLQNTNSGGSPKVGGNFSLLRGLLIDQNRAQLQQSKFGLDRARAETKLTKVQTRRDSTLVYWNWIIGIRNYNIFEELYKLADNRRNVLDQRVRAGDISDVVAKENMQYLARRRAELASAELQLKQAALDLSLFYRDQASQPILLDIKDPEGIDQMLDARIDAVIAKAVENKTDVLELANLGHRLDVFSLSQELKMNEVGVKLAQNNFWPKLDVGIDYVRNIGGEDRTVHPHVLTVFVSFEIPIEYDFALGQSRSAQAQKRVTESRYKFLVESAKTEIQKIGEAIRLSRQRMVSAREEMDYAKQLLQAENYKFTKGGSNFFLINIREEALAQAQSNFFFSQYDVIKAYADYEVATAQYHP